MEKPITAAQCRAARAMLQWKTSELAEVAKIGINTVTRFENGDATTAATAELLKNAFERHGIELIDDDAKEGAAILKKKAKKKAAGK